MGLKKTNIKVTRDPRYLEGLVCVEEVSIGEGKTKREALMNLTNKVQGLGVSVIYDPKFEPQNMGFDIYHGSYKVLAELWGPGYLPPAA